MISRGNKILLFRLTLEDKIADNPLLTHNLSGFSSNKNQTILFDTSSYL